MFGSLITAVGIIIIIIILLLLLLFLLLLLMSFSSSTNFWFIKSNETKIFLSTTILPLAILIVKVWKWKKYITTISSAFFFWWCCLFFFFLVPDSWFKIHSFTLSVHFFSGLNFHYFTNELFVFFLLLLLLLIVSVSFWI